MQPQPSGGDQGQTAKALYDHQAGKYGEKTWKYNTKSSNISWKLKNLEMFLEMVSAHFDIWVMA